jgi:hypothetical protein
LVGKPEAKRPFTRPTRRWEDNIKMVLWKLGFGEWIGVIWLKIGTVAAVVNTVMNIQVL